MSLPVLFYPAERKRQDMRGQMGDLNPGQDQKPAVIGQVFQVEFSSAQQTTRCNDRGREALRPGR